MYIFATSVYPNEKAKEVADMYLKAVTKYPDNNMKMLILFRLIDWR
jgi:hypothetical protein